MKALLTLTLTQGMQIKHERSVTHTNNMTGSVTYLHMSVESWVPKVYSVEAILLMSSAAPVKELLLNSSHTKHSYSCTRLCSGKLTAITHSHTVSIIHSCKKKKKPTLLILRICGSFYMDMEKE